MKEALEKYPVLVEFPVHWSDMDAARHVNNLKYLVWAETARIEYFDRMGMDTSFQGEGIGPILGWQECKYIFPMTFPDQAIVGIRTQEIQADRFILESAVFSKKHQRIAAISWQRIVPYSYQDLAKAAMPEEWVAGINKIEEAS